MAKAKSEDLPQQSGDQNDPAADDRIPEVRPDSATRVRARVLAYCNLGAPNDVIEIGVDEVENLRGIVDTDPAAVAYALSAQV